MNTDLQMARRMRELETGVPLCAVVGVFGPCPHPAVAQVTMGCVHEHMRVGPMCGDHAANASHADSGADCGADCGACFEGEARHDCPLAFIAASPIGVPA